MNTSVAKKWAEAAKILTQDPAAVVRCPECNDGVLTVHDEVFKADPTMMERYLVCNKCGARNVIRMRVPVG
jgi:DNA-directed RNA polymerase subunit RPC12/RpoP